MAASLRLLTELEVGQGRESALSSKVRCAKVFSHCQSTLPEVMESGLGYERGSIKRFLCRIHWKARGRAAKHTRKSIQHNRWQRSETIARNELLKTFNRKGSKWAEDAKEDVKVELNNGIRVAPGRRRNRSHFRAYSGSSYIIFYKALYGPFHCVTVRAGSRKTFSVSGYQNMLVLQSLFLAVIPFFHSFPLRSLEMLLLPKRLGIFPKKCNAKVAQHDVLWCLRTITSKKHPIIQCCPFWDFIPQGSGKRNAVNVS